MDTSLSSAPASRPTVAKVALLLGATLFLAAAEFTARAQDWFVQGTPFLEAPSEETSLFVNTPDGRRGKPNGHFGKWALNSFGFRSPEITIVPRAGTVRVMTLGSSETFGLFESPGHEFPAELQKLLRGLPQIEVVNAGLPGLTMYSARSYYDTWVSRFRPSIVVVYPSPLFYLHDIAPGDHVVRQPKAQSTLSQSAAARLGGFVGSSRIVGRLRDILDVPEPIERWREARTIRAAVEGHQADWMFQATPRDRLQRFMADLQALVTSIRGSGAVVILATHATRVSNPPTAQDSEVLWRERVFFPRATSDVVASFNVDANVAVRKWAEEARIPLVDAAAAMDGKKGLFADLVHFSDAGSEQMARQVNDTLLGELTRITPMVSDRALQ